MRFDLRKENAVERRRAPKDDEDDDDDDSCMHTCDHRNVVGNRCGVHLGRLPWTRINGSRRSPLVPEISYHEIRNRNSRSIPEWARIICGGDVRNACPLTSARFIRYLFIYAFVSAKK